MTVPRWIAGLRRWLLALGAAVALAASARADGGPAGHAHGSGPCPCVWCRRPYCTDNCLYGYQDHVYGRGPVIQLGAGNLQPGFRGYGVFGSPGYGIGLAPSTRIDTLPPFYRWKHGGWYRP